MPLVSQPEQVAAIYTHAAERGLCLANFCTANRYTTESILRSAYEFGCEHGLKDVPVVVSVTANYPIEPQLVSYTSLKNAALGMKALVNDVALLVAPDSPYAGLQVMLHLDHGQPEADEGLFDWAADRFATIMYDASAWPMAQNIAMTRRFVERMRGRVLVEGAVAEIAQAVDHADAPLTTPEDAERFFNETGVSLIVPDLGTEHRSTAVAARYDGDRARAIQARIGSRMVLHGSSSLPDSDLGRLPSDGIVKVNVWTVFERIGGQAVARDVLQELPRILPVDELRALYKAGVIGRQVLEAASGTPQLDSLREERRRDVWQAAVVARMKFFLEQYGYGNWTPV
ncbi:MAG: class II fructose-bisphosphate aldolase [Chloroflexi bacterium]|nr:class II fructose-bisphosphate aldolase [Chloroflexota bacterium]